MISIDIANIPAEVLEQYKTCGREISAGVLELDETSECYKACVRERMKYAKRLEPTPAMIEARLIREGYTPEQMSKFGCGC